MIDDLRREFQRHRRLAEAAAAGLDDAAFFQQPAPAVHSVAVIVKHLAGNFRSRWTNFLGSDGDKPDRNRESEFVIEGNDSRTSLMTAWQSGWSVLEQLLDGLGEADLARIVTIRGEPHTVQQALLRGLTHTAWHTGQILYIARLLNPTAPWLTIAPGASASHRANYLAKPSERT